MVRCFVGIFLPDNIKPNVQQIQGFIKALDIDCKFIEPENLHLTLSFLGEIVDAKLEGLKRDLDAICRNFKAFSVSVGGTKLIPNANYVRVIALDVIDNLGYLPHLSNEIKKDIGGDVKPPHLTLCRVRKINKGEVLSKLLYMDSFCGEFQVNSVQLIKSELSRGGPVYSTLHESKLV